MSFTTIFVILLAAVFAIIAYFSEPSDAEKRTRERLADLSMNISQPYENDILRRTTYSRIAIVDRILRKNRLALTLESQIEQAKLSWTVGRFCFYSLVLMIVGGAVGNWWVPVGILGWVPGMLLGGLPLAWVVYKRSARLRKLNLMLPEGVDLMARALRAGYSLPSSLVMVADEMPDPLGPEFRRASDELSFGLSFREALGNLSRRIPITDLNFLVTAILVQKETGGNLIELFEKTAAVLRSRVQLERKVRVYTAQGRMTGAVLVSMPFILFVVLNLVRPGYTAPLFESQTGRTVVYGALCSMAIGVLVIRRIINGIKV
ncbi:MAG TPA: type II secretion system F family protein [Candidatus Bathyarchaeia archaeon]|nr:type II secretion system F family protein [Candidatus Bathyarchaeia archaeon]